MHRGFTYYYREGLKLSGKTIYRNKCFFRYLLYFLAEFFGRIAVIFNLHFNIANVRQGYVIRKANKLNFSSSFRSVGHRAHLGTYLLTLCLEGLIILAGIVGMAVLAVILGSIGYGISKLASYEDYLLFILIFSAPSLPLAVLYVAISLLIFSPTAYLIVNNEDISVGETIGACYRSMINNGKMTVFLSCFISLLLKVLYLGAVAVGGYFLLTLLIPEEYFLIALIGWAVIFFVVYLLFAPVLTLANRVAQEHLFEDIVIDPVVCARINEKVNLAVCKGKKIKTVTSQDLASLFDYTEDPYRILEETERKSRTFDVAPTEDKKKNKKKRDAESDSIDDRVGAETPIELVEKPTEPTTKSEEAAKPVEVSEAPTKPIGDVTDETAAELTAEPESASNPAAESEDTKTD